MGYPEKEKFTQGGSRDGILFIERASITSHNIYKI